jgi:hypothetical protein
MSNEPSSVDVADTVSELIYGVAGWLLVGLGLLAFLSGVGGTVQTAGTAEMVVPLLLLVFAFTFLTSGVLVNPRFRRRLDRRSGLTRFGRARTVDRRVLSAAENHRESCVSCDSDLTEGLVRRYREELLVAGVPVWTASEGRNFYCADCAVEDMSTPTVLDDEDDKAREQAMAESG